MSKKILFILTIFTLLTLSACGGANYSYAEAPAAEPMSVGQTFGGGMDDSVRSYDAEEPAYDYDEGSTAANTATGDTTERMVIKNADLSIVVEDPIQKMDEVDAMTKEMGGFVVSSNVWQATLHNGSKVPHASITIRIPSERLDEALDRIKTGVGEITHENVSGQDVTSEYTDLQSRLRNWEATEARLQEIMDDAEDTEDVLSVYSELSRVRENIEVIKGQMQYFEQAAALSAVSIDISGDEEAQPIQIGGWKPGGVAKDAIETMIDTLQWLGDVAIWFVLCVLPIGVIIGIPLYFGGRGVWRIRKRRKAEKAAQQVEKPETE